MAEGIDVRLIGPEDAGVFAHVADGVFDEPPLPARVDAYLAEPGHLMALAFDGDRVVGQVAAVIHRHPDKPAELYLDEVGVADAYLRRGIATRMVERMLAEGRARGCAECWVGTEPDNEAARALYRKWQDEAEPFVMYLFDL
ncbi:GNAT family N-acetyltransferase [Sphingomonas gilva]|uniref:GNAT family N-acetyltransferase n=1 Tax=Sphingomonas gilva TaxID=2305907 RepID=UPI001CA40ED6|nr:GNAT family N-acetyltransferase [Sphingomonas gilva]